MLPYLPEQLVSTTVTNIKNIKSDLLEVENCKPICNVILESIKNVNSLHFLTFRDNIYDIFIYNLNITECIWYIQSELFKDGFLKKEHYTDMLKQTHVFFKYYNNNYRPIYHLEKYFYFIISLIYWNNTTTVKNK
jgi:hypothetical protein